MLDLAVVVLNYNTRDLLRRCLGSILLEPTLVPRLVYVVDNCSTDGSAAMVRQEFPAARLIEAPRNGGFAYGNNLALQEIMREEADSRPRYLLLLNPDTWVPDGGLAEMVAYLDARPDAGAAGPRLVLGDGRLDLACRRSFPTPGVAIARILGLSRLFPRSQLFARYNLTFLEPGREAEVDAVSGAFMMVRSETVAQVGLLDEAFFMYGEDLDWAYRMKRLGWRVLYNPLVEVVHYKGQASRQRSYRGIVAFYQAMHVFYQKHYAPRTFFLINWMVTTGIAGQGVIALVVNALRPRDRKRVA